MKLYLLLLKGFDSARIFTFDTDPGQTDRWKHVGHMSDPRISYQIWLEQVILTGILSLEILTKANSV